MQTTKEYSEADLTDLLIKEFEFWLKAAYMYYWAKRIIVPNYTWDLIGVKLSNNWSRWDHPLKHLVEKDKMHSARHIPKEAYPNYTD